MERIYWPYGLLADTRIAVSVPVFTLHEAQNTIKRWKTEYGDKLLATWVDESSHGTRQLDFHVYVKEVMFNDEKR